ncbi:chorismate-binding protein [Tsukamurella soli]|uniref:Isochorismate synthase n=1 Tax=Tsukamurella soli TaxID=644556 RepID=A0ABP8JAG1_9ACTN
MTAGGPHFLLAGSGAELTARGAVAAFTEPAAAAAALRRGRHRIVVGAMPFDLGEPAALVVPESVEALTVPCGAATGRCGLPALEFAAECPVIDDYLARVREVIRRIETGELERAVLARVIEFAAAEPVDAIGLARHLARRDIGGNAFHVDLGPAGPAHTDRVLVGSSHEVLVHRRGDTVVCHPWTCVDAHPDGLLDPPDELDRHAAVVDAVATVLGPLCTELEVPQGSSVACAGDGRRLSTVVTGRIRDAETSALDLALALHPTPAVCGSPKAAATRAIAEVEGQRGFFAGLVGWTDMYGDGHWRVASRCAELGADRKSLRAWAGCGVVAGSNPALELAETADKLRTVLGPFRILATTG